MIVRKLRLQRGWSQEQLAEIAGLSTRTIQRLERGQTSSIETMNALAAVFEVDRSILETGGTNMNGDTGISSGERDAIRYVKGLKEFYSHVLMYAIFVIAFGLARGFTDPLILWGAIGWGLGVVLHALIAHEVFNFFGPRWEKRQIERRLGRKL